MEHLLVELNDLPDEILLMIFKKLNNVSLLCSLISVNRRLNTIVRDPIFTCHLKLMRHSPNDSIGPLPNTTLDRLCSEILPEIRNQIQRLDLESSSIERILLATNYPNLYGLGLFNLDTETALSLFGDQSSLMHINKNQISFLIINITEIINERSMEHPKTFVFTQIFIQYPNLQYLNFGPSSTLYRHLSFSNSSPICISSNLLELHVSLSNFTDCLYILDGRFNQLRIFHVNISSIYAADKKVAKEEKLLNLKCFSLHCDEFTNVYNEFILPLVCRMSNLENLDLNLLLHVKEKFIDGNDLKKNLIKHMTRLEKFTFNIYSILLDCNQIDLQPLEYIQNTFNNFKYNQIICSVDYCETRGSRCRIYSYPYKLKFYNDITNNFSGELFTYVRRISLSDKNPFEHEFFLRIEKSFPFVEKISMRNFQPQNNKLCTESNDDNQHWSIVKYSHLTNLTLNTVHDDYVEQFLDNRKVCLPNNVHLDIGYEQLKRVTNNFTRNITQINCRKLKSMCLYGDEISQHVKDYFPHTEIICL
ncbi:unnamed protein product [Adineta steineri]|uniref:F-box domain-containing protein n=1 Tax=Adineta steineri TaxID=433720 RepID=A0A814W152_9BILA|nr:unnamed protein product [Adineta steineri]